MNDISLTAALEELPHPVAGELLQDAGNFVSLIDAVAQSALEEAVPAEMMQVFTDEQWGDLLFELQPGAALFSSLYDIASLHQSWLETGELVLPAAGDRVHWLMYNDQEGLIVRMLIPEEFQALEMATERRSFSEMAAVLWPDLDSEKAQHKMTEMLLVWLQDRLIIDAGVALPEDAEFED